jgi:ATP-dependent RNA helicase MRH4
LPIFNHLKSTDAGPNPSKDPDAPLAPRAVIISPTHELTRQSTAVAKALAHSVKLGVVGGSSSTKGLRGWAGETDLVFATGGTLRSMFKGGVGENSPEDEMKELREGPARKRVPMRLDRVEWLVIDEADVMLGECGTAGNH